MFLVHDSSSSREARIQQFLAEEPSLAVLLAVIHFEWTIRLTMPRSVSIGQSTPQTMSGRFV